jgi:phage portal protein BeeE
VSVVYACVSVIAQQIALMQAYVWTRTDGKTVDCH